jgi:hypothetical protein
MLQTKALYNLLRIQAREDRSIKADPWALENLRLVEAADLWKRLAKLGISLDKSSFLQFAEETGSPEELAELLVSDDVDSKGSDRIYLVLFELWRRLLPERLSLSIFCDELDSQIELYDADQLESDESIQDGLANLVGVLEEHVDAGMDPKKAFAALVDYCAHDLESFIYDYIADLLDQENLGYASELLELFEPFMTGTEWVALLRARLMAASNPNEANRAVKALVEKQAGLDFLVEALRFLIVAGEAEPFRITMNKILSQLLTEEEFQEVIDMAADYYRRLDCDEIE